MGYVYVLRNKGLPGLMKIGRSEKGGWFRRMQLSNTGLPYPFELVFEIMSYDEIRLEIAIHSRLEPYRENRNREFFRLDETAATLAVVDAWLTQSGFDSDFFNEWRDWKAQRANVKPPESTPEPTPEEIAANKARARETLAGLRALIGDRNGQN